MGTRASYTQVSTLPETTMSFLIARILNLFTQPANDVVPGARVNHVSFGSLINMDGRVEEVSPWGRALVRWPRGGDREWLPQRHLVVTEAPVSRRVR
jgi:hypothetical protein